MSNFEIASREKYRYKTPQGVLDTEMLWDLPLTSKNGANLDDLALIEYKKIKSSGQISFVKAVSTSNKEAETKLAIIKHIIAVKMTEKEAEKNRKSVAIQKQKLLAIKEKRQEDALENLSDEELDKQLAELG